MTAEQISALTLGELEAIAQRLEAAAKVVRQARQELLGGAVAPQPALFPSVAAPPAILTPQELAQRQYLLQRNRDEALPEEIKRAERSTPP